jgi:hypothetical protein
MKSPAISSQLQKILTLQRKFQELFDSTKKLIKTPPKTVKASSSCIDMPLKHSLVYSPFMRKSKASGRFSFFLRDLLDVYTSQRTKSVRARELAESREDVFVFLQVPADGDVMVT